MDIQDSRRELLAIAGRLKVIAENLDALVYANPTKETFEFMVETGKKAGLEADFICNISQKLLDNY